MLDGNLAPPRGAAPPTVGLRAAWASAPALDAKAPAARIVADIGGTNARFAYQGERGAAPEFLETLDTAEYASLSDALRAYLSGLAARLGPRARPSAAVLAVATAVSGDEVKWTNHAWSFSKQALQREMGFHQLTVLNDFEALALSLPHLRPGQLIAHPGPAPAQPHPVGAMLAVVGPGTGLGVAGLKHTPGGWVALATEGGHATLAAHTPLEASVLEVLQKSHAHVSAERLLCGSGLSLLHHCLAAIRGETAETLSAKDIVALGLADPACAASQTLDVFCAWLGSFCGNVALTLGARGGLYVGGGIVPRMGQRFFDSDFRARFEAKGRFAPYLAKIPTQVIADTFAALTGAANAD